MQAVCDPTMPFDNLTFIGMRVLRRHTSKAFHHRNLYQGTARKSTVFGITNPETNLKLSVGVVVDKDFNFDSYLPNM